MGLHMGLTDMPMRHTVRSAAARVLATTAAALALGGCATKGDIRDLRTELRDLAIRQDSVLVELRRATLSTQDTLRGQSDQLFDFRGTVSSQITAMTGTLDRIEAAVGENQRGIIGVRDQLANMRRTPVTMPVLGDSGSVAPGVAGMAGMAGTDQAVSSPGDATGVFNAAVTAFNKGTLTTARMAFQQFLESFPNDALAPDAQFYLADILQKDGSNEDALAAFKRIRELYPAAAKVPEALYRVAIIQIDMGKKSEARTTLQLIINSYPAADVAALARDRLKELG